jgi:hypothetical protein
MDADQIARLVAARCGDSLNEAEIGDVAERLTGTVVPMQTFEHVLAVLAAMQTRLAQLEERVSATPRDNRLRFGSGVSADADAYTGAMRPIRVERT